MSASATQGGHKEGARAWAMHHAKLEFLTYYALIQKYHYNVDILL